MAEDTKIPAAGSTVATNSVAWPAPGETITSLATKNTYTIGDRISEGFFGSVYACVDVWSNDLAAKVLKPIGTYEHVRFAAEAGLGSF